MAQVKQGTISYDRTDQFQVRFNDPSGQAPQNLPHSRTTKFELLFANNQSVYQKSEDVPEETGDDNNGSGMHIRMMMPGGNDIIYRNFSSNQVIAQRELGTKTYLISDSIPHTDWKISDQTKTVAGYTCKMATTTRTSQSMRVNNNNGQVTSQQVNDTLHITAWFTDAIPIAAGPDNYCGLPGLILALDVNNGRTVYVATDISPKVDASDMKQPKSGKQVTQAQFDDERKKMFAEMQQNRGAFAPPPPK